MAPFLEGADGVVGKFEKIGALRGNPEGGFATLPTTLSAPIRGGFAIFLDGRGHPSLKRRGLGAPLSIRSHLHRPPLHYFAALPSALSETSDFFPFLSTVAS